MQKKTKHQSPKNSLPPVNGLMQKSFQGKDIESIKAAFVRHLEFSLAKDEYSSTQRDLFKSLAFAVRDRLIEQWITTQQTYYKKDAKRIYYLSMEFLIGRLLGDSLINLGIYENANKALKELGYDLEELREIESDAALGNGGLGRLAACFLDSMSTLELPAYGYGIRYEYGIFSQKIENGYQHEAPDNWLRYGNPWEIERPEYIYTVKYYGKVNTYHDDGKLVFDWVDTENVIAMAYDTPIPGYQNNTVNNLRLWAAKATREFNLEYFNYGDYTRAVTDKIDTETISKVLYPKDDFYEGKELRLKQEYFLVSATLQDIVRRYKKTHEHGFTAFPDKVAIQLNDTHPALAIPELMRILIDQEGLDWEKAWNICVHTFGYTNHTVLPEALEKWPVNLLAYILPRHLEIILEINRRMLENVERIFPGDIDRQERMSIVEEGPEKQVRMANLAICGSHSVNGVAALHTEIITSDLFNDFFKLNPEKFNNKTNGITQRRWLRLSNPALADLITETIGDDWIRDLYKLKRLEKFADDKSFQKKWQQIKINNKRNLAKCITKNFDVEININSMFDCQTKRMHEYKRQLLNVFHVITMYNRIKANPKINLVPRTVIISGKSAPGYYIAKLIIKLIHSVGEVINNDEMIGNKLKLLFLSNYSVSLAQKIIPAADLSQQISTAGMEASGTGNMKYALNGALTIGTLDGANIEIMEEVGIDNIFIFGLTAEEVLEKRARGENPHSYYNNNPELKQVIDMIAGGFFSQSEPDLFKPLINALLHHSDYYMVLADYADYIRCQERINDCYRNKSEWTRKSILNVANMGKFSSDRTIQEYCRDIWHAKPIPINMNRKE